jgi:predicted lipoprotein
MSWLPGLGGNVRNMAMGKYKNIRVIQTVVVLGAACWMLSGCRIEHKSEPGQDGQAQSAGSSEKPAFNAAAEVQAMWAPKVLPAIEKMAVDYRDLKKEMLTSLDTAGAKHGNREKGEGAPWNLAVKITGKIVDADTELRAGTADIDVDGDGKADVQLQMGPVVKGSSLRDFLPFISFTSYTNQIDFAQLANALNDQAYSVALKSIDRKNLKGKKVEVFGVFTTDSADDQPVVTVTSFKVLEK